MNGFICKCPVAGYCATFRREMVGRLYEICSGNYIGPPLPSSTRAQYLATWLAQSGVSALPTGLSRTLPCRHLGAELREQECVTCGGHVLVKVFACPLHQECTLAKPLPGIATCAGCQDRA